MPDGECIPDGQRIFSLAALTVFASILLHGLTDTPGTECVVRPAEAIAAQSAQMLPARPPT